MPTYTGSCHCGAVRFEIEKVEPIENLVDCNCSICIKKGIIHVPVQDSELTKLEGEEDLALYQFGSKVAKHQFCRHCGIHVMGRPRNSPERLTVNARCLDEFEQVRDTARILRFDGQNHPKDQG